MPNRVPRFGPAVTCPYCYTTFRERRIEFRCTGQLSPTGRRCAPENDNRLDERFSIRMSLPPVFSANGRRMRATCKNCEGPTTQRVCPTCHSLLPVHFGKIDSRLIAMIGAKATGKTVYMTVLLHELMHSVGKRFEASVMGCDDDTRKAFSLDYEDLIYRRNRLPGTTKPGQAQRKQPLVFKISLDNPGRIGAKDRHTITSFFDTAGEDLNGRASAELNARYLRAANGIILLLDPLQMRGARENAAPGTLPDLNDTESPENVLARVTEMLHEQIGDGPGKRIRMPIAVAFSKIDALQHSLPSGSPLLRSAPAEGAWFDEADSLSVHEHVQSLLHEWDGAQIDLTLQRNYADYRYFGLSSLGAAPVAGNQVDPTRGVQPYRVADPFLWLMSRFNALPVKKS